MQICTRCVLPESYPNIHFDGQGVCNFCASYQPPVYHGKEALIKQVNKRRNSTSGYDAVIGLSGGRDSSFAAHFAVRELGLKIMGFTFDKGFMPDVTRENIRNTVEILGLEHTVYDSGGVTRSVKSCVRGLTHKPSAAMAAFLCSGCHLGISEGEVFVTEKYNCPLVITGGGEPEDTFAEYLLSGSDSRDRRYLVSGFIREISANPLYLQPQLLASFAREYLNRFTRRKKAYTKLQIFRYIPWDEKQIMETITGQLRWRVPDKMSSSWRSDCNVNVIRQYLYRELLGFTKNEEMLSQQVRSGAITRQEALTRLETENDINGELLAEIFEKLDLPVDKFFQAVEKAKQAAV